jgi:hypothetical protein
MKPVSLRAAECGWDLAEWLDCQSQSRNSPGFDFNILPRSGIGGAADETVFDMKKIQNLLLFSWPSFRVRSGVIWEGASGIPNKFFRLLNTG